MSKRLEILKASLIKKQAAFDAKLAAHIADVKRANGQPMNDKRNGAATFARWEKQNESLRKLDKEIQITKDAIEREEMEIHGCERAKEELPKEILALLESGDLIQWRKYPNRFFINGVDKFRLIWEKGQLMHKYSNQVTDPEQRKKMVTIANTLISKLKK